MVEPMLTRSASAASRYPCGSGFPRVMSSALMSTSGKGMPAARMRLLARTRLAEVTTAHADRGSEAMNSAAPGTSRTPSVVDSSCSTRRLVSLAIRAGWDRKWRTVAAVGLP